MRLAAFALAALATFFPPALSAQRPPVQPNAAEILHRMQKLNVVGSVLYVVAHPDDENTRLITWLANGKKVRTGNLSLTRGDGGQNLIGPELGDALGIIRTQELMEARRIDGGEQFFTRAVDFGFSKNAAESFEKWGRQEVLSDVVRVIRTFRPDVIITRFAPDRSAGHGHHEASAILAHEAFDLAGDPNAFPEQLKEGLEVWQPRRLFFNGSTWWKRDLAEFAQTDPDWFVVDVGGYDPLLGVSYTEFAGRSRSMHKSQGFGAAEVRGPAMEYLKFVKGDRPAKADIFDGIPLGWDRLGAPQFADRIAALIAAFDPQHPARSIEGLIALLNALEQDPKVMAQVPHVHMAVQQLIANCAGLAVEVLGPRALVAHGGATAEVVVTNRSPWPVKVLDVFPSGGAKGPRPVWADTVVPAGQQVVLPWMDEVPAHQVDEPFWLHHDHGTLHRLDDPRHIGRPVMPRTVDVRIRVGPDMGATIVHRVTPLYKWVDRVAGERIRPVSITPVASVIPKGNNLIARGGPQTIEVEVEALTDSLVGQLNISLPGGWGTTKDIKRVDIATRHDRQKFIFQLMPAANAEAGVARFEFVGPQGRSDRTLHEIDHPHIMPQVYYTPAEVKLVPLDVKCTARRVGYIKGAGDDVPQALEQLGVQVDVVDPALATLNSLKNYDAIVVGIRAYNTVKALKELNPVLKQYVEEGGTLVVQYNTTPSFGLSGLRDMVVDPPTLGPYPFTITRGRVTVEEAPPTFLDPEHPLLNTPNKITMADFDGWVQERGLYFLGDVDPRYTKLIAWNDPGEDPLDGALITCDHGKGRYVYTGISFFRQLPAGVPGAYRLFANLISPRTTGAVKK
jgi:LmbE family N-acetylglucosaminyl deacetylase